MWGDVAPPQWRAVTAPNFATIQTLVDYIAITMFLKFNYRSELKVKLIRGSMQPTVREATRWVMATRARYWRVRARRRYEKIYPNIGSIEPQRGDRRYLLVGQQ
eukprot:Blabericola_migrator_1__10509@NODE_5961_length_634_cov_2_539683_g3957_i0_p1_GENE_NODE_5961_length_634_cov_2_539683_g3957_i0NODE_5961_length_634_cov_2_539683_g3957_i0_p1_ORF_typecomplete_len104_score4_30_NODE_5961_length_634_cov_2_539683_g3957_i0117428